MSYLGIFWLELEKATPLWFFYISTLEFFQTKLRLNIKILKFGTKIALIGYFGLEFQKVSNLKSVSSISNLLTCKVSSKNKNFLNLVPKIPYLGIFGLQFNKNYCQFFNQHTQICETIKVSSKMKKSNLGPKMLYLRLWLKTVVIFLIFFFYSVFYVDIKRLTIVINKLIHIGEMVFTEIIKHHQI